MYAILDHTGLSFVPVCPDLADYAPILHRDLTPAFRAYMQPRGLDKRLPFNHVAWTILQRLGFTDASRGYMAYCGPVILSGDHGQGLSAADMAQIQWQGLGISTCPTTSDWDTYPKRRQTMIIV